MCIILDIRLVGGNVPTEGRVEIIVDGEWGTICDFGWDLNDAHTVCRQLGYQGASEALSGAYFGEGVGNISMSWVSCPTETEDNLEQCTYSSPVGCYHSNDSSVRCFIGRKYFTSLLINDHIYTRCFLWNGGENILQSDSIFSGGGGGRGAQAPPRLAMPLWFSYL